MERGHLTSAAVPGKRLLLVEDNELTLEILAFVLRGRGYAVSAAANGREALGRLRAGPLPDCILLDLRMPVMDGRQFRANQLADPALAGIPVLLLSGLRDLPQQAAALGAAGYLRKPVGDEDLVAAVERCCRPASPAAPAT
jgi:CheY-like chemotaxis protein